MLNGIRIYTADNIWRKIFIDFGVCTTDDKLTADINIDLISLNPKISVLELKSVILNFIDKNQSEILKIVFGKVVILSKLQKQIIIFLFKTGGLVLLDLNMILGYATDSSTNAASTAIYELRKKYGRDFIKNNNGKYFLGKL